MTATHFEKIQICCSDVYQSVQEYSLVFGQQPVWSGQYTHTDSSGRVVDNGACAWFVLDNTHIELFSSGLPDQKLGITGFVLAMDSDGETDNKASNGLMTFLYRDVQEEAMEERFLDKPRHKEDYGVSLRVSPSQRQSGEGFVPRQAARIQRVDHLVIYSNDAQACLERFGELGLGMRLALDKTVPKWGGRMLFFRCGKLTLEIIIPDKPLDRPDYCWGIAYQTDDLDRTVDELTRDGVLVSSIREGRKPGTRVASLKTHDLSVPTLLIEPKAL